MNDIPKSQPPWLQQILDNHDRALGESREATKQALDENKKEREEFLKKVDEVTSAFRKDFSVLEDKQAETSHGMKVIQEEVNEIKTSIQIHTTDISAIDHRIDDTKQELMNEIENLRAEFNEKLAGKATNPARPIVPSSASVADQCLIEREFTSLLQKARNMDNCFAMGRVSFADVIGVVPAPKTVQQVFHDYFARIKFEIIPAMGKSQIRRLRVAKDHLNIFRENLELYEMQIRSDGWWLAQDLPPELRLLRSNAFKFYKEAKSLYTTVLAVYFDVSLNSGYVTVDGIELFPVYMVPKDHGKWAALFPIFQRIVDLILAVEWVDKKTSAVPVSPELVQEWADAVGMSAPPSNSGKNDSDTEMHDALDHQGCG
jgi:hypothetical protein